MGRTTKPLNILVAPSLADSPEVKELEEKGHFITIYLEKIKICSGESLEDFDLILHPNAWRMDRQHLLYLKIAVEEAQAMRYRKAEDIKHLTGEVQRTEGVRWIQSQRREGEPTSSDRPAV